MIRAFYTAVAKSIHTPARRAHESTPPTPQMRATALTLALVVKRNLAHDLPALSTAAAAAAAEPSTSAGAAALAPAPEVARIRREAAHLYRLAEEVQAVLIDLRRRSCHSLVLSYFVVLGGVQVLGKRFGEALQLLLVALELQPAAPTSGVASCPAPSRRMVQS